LLYSAIIGKNKMKWLSVKEKLPIPNNWNLYAVLVSDEKLYRHQIAFYSKRNKWYIESNQKKSIKVTHYIVLPENP